MCLAATDTTRADGAAAPPSARELLRELVEINTTHANGSTEAARALAAHFLAAGFARLSVYCELGPYRDRCEDE
jgi:acetylornithine deacetylase/succinyl-diaminopimelate desuccinylase-like protein